MMGGGMGGGRPGGFGGGMGRMGMGRGNFQDEGGKVYDHTVVVRLMGFVTPYWRHMVLAILAVIVYTASVATLPYLVKEAIDGYINVNPPDMSGLRLVVLAFLVIAALQFFGNYVQLRIMAFVGQRVLYALRVTMFKHLQKLSMSYYDRHQVGSIMSRVQNDVQQLQEFLNFFVTTLADVLSIGGIVAVMFYMSPKLALITLSVVPVLFIVLTVWQRYAKLSFIRVRGAIAEVNSGLQENITGVRVVQSLNRQGSNIRRFGAANHEHLDANLQAGRFSAGLMPTVEILTAIGLALVVVFGGVMVLNDELEVGALIAFALYIQRFFEPVRNLTMEYGQLQRAMASGARIFELLDTEPEVVDAPSPVRLEQVRGEVKYERVGFQYGSDPAVLKGVDLDIQAGETVALVGPTGAGKTTMVSLMMRLYDVTEGRITVDGHDIKEVSLDSLARQLSVVPQEPFLFSGTVSENIRYNRAETSDEDIERAARAVGAHDFISRLANGYETQLQERGGNLSVGQRQLISFARALAADPRILILDEATANIDTHTEMLIQEALSELLRDRTALVIAHRLSTIRNSDRIVVVDEGRLVEQGNHAELIARDGLYARLYSYSTDGAVGDAADGDNGAGSLKGLTQPHA